MKFIFVSSVLVIGLICVQSEQAEDVKLKTNIEAPTGLFAKEKMIFFRTISRSETEEKKTDIGSESEELNPSTESSEFSTSQPLTPERKSFLAMFLSRLQNKLKTNPQSDKHQLE